MEIVSPSATTVPSWVREPTGFGVDLERLRPAHARAAHAPRDDRRVRGLATPAREDAARRHHAVEVVGGGLPTDEDDVGAGLGATDRGAGVEHRLADGRPGRRAHPDGHRCRAALVVEVGEHQLGELVAGHAEEGLVLGEHAVLEQVVGDAEGGLGGALAHPGLEHPQVPLLDGELDVAHVAVVLLEALHVLHEGAVARRVEAFEVGEREGVADAGHDVLALGVGQVVAVLAGGSRRGIAGERDARAGGRAAVPEHHRLHVDRGAEVGGNAFAPAVEDRPLGVPRVEDREHGAAQLVAGVLRERPAGVLLDDREEGRDEPAEVVGVEVDIGGDASRVLGRVDGLLEAVAVDAEDRPAVHLDQPPVGVPGEALVAGAAGEGGDAGVAEPDVEHRLHHPRHREPGPGPDGDEQRVVGVAEPAAHPLLERVQVGVHLVEQPLRNGPVREVGTARVGRDGEARGHRQPEPGHLREVGALAAEQVREVPAPGLEVVDELGHGDRLLAQR